jgi:hypothetical protein
MPWTMDPTSMGPADVAVIGFADHAFRPELAAQQAAAAQAQQAVASPAADAGPGPDDDVIAKIRQLGEQKQQGLLSDEEFAALKAKLMSSA